MKYLSNMKQKITKAVIPAAGLGTRFLPVTKAVPKEMIPIIDKPMIHYIVEEAINSGIQDIVMITSPNKESLERYFGHNYELEDRLMKNGKEELAQSIRKIAQSCNMIFVHQKEPLGLGHAVGVAQPVVGNEPFAILLGDDLIDSKVPCTRQLMDIFDQQEKSVVGVMEVPEADVSKYGIVAGQPLAGASGKTIVVDNMIEKPKASEAPSRYAIPGRYVLAPQIFEHIRNTKPSKGGEIQLTDALLSLAKTQGLLAHCFEGDRYDTGDRIGYLDATLTFGLRRPELREGLMKVLKKHVQ
jgi:UTP--glucose-1-phosphate uridylyltransferase